MRFITGRIAIHGHDGEVLTRDGDAGHRRSPLAGVTQDLLGSAEHRIPDLVRILFRAVPAADALHRTRGTGDQIAVSLTSATLGPLVPKSIERMYTTRGYRQRKARRQELRVSN